MRWFKPKKEEVRRTLEELLIQGNVETEEVTREQAISIPAVSACLELICSTIASLPIYLFKEAETDKIEKVDRSSHCFFK